MPKQLLFIIGLFVWMNSSAQSIENGANSKFDVQVSPNPASDWITVKTNQVDAKIRFVLLDAQNNLISFSQQAVKSSFSINISSLKSGTYYLNLSTADGKGQKVVQFVKN